MNDVVQSTNPLYQISFILEGYRYQQDIRMEDDQAQVLRKRLSSQLSLSDDVQDLQVYLLNEDKDRFDAFSALDLLETLTEAVSVDLSAIDAEEEPGLEELRVLAEALSASAETAEPTSLKAIQIDFTWNNGGGDDNAFTDGYAAPSGTDDQRAVFQQALTGWLEACGHAYDVCYREVTDDSADTTDLCTGLEELVETLKDNGLDEDSSIKWIKILESEIAREREISSEIPKSEQARPAAESTSPEATSVSARKSPRP